MRIKRKSNGIVATSVSAPDFQSRHPKFSFEYLGGKYCITSCEIPDRSEFAVTLHKISKLTWADLQQLGRKNGGFETLPVKELKCKVPDVFMTYEKAIVFHNPRKKAVIGFREEENYFIVAIDHDFTAYKH